MSNEALNSQEFDVAAELAAVQHDVLAIVPQATDSKKLSSVESLISEDTRIVLANRKNEDPVDSDFIVSKLRSVPGQPLQRETYRWSSSFPESHDLQIYESVAPDKASGKPNASQRKSFTQDDLARLKDLVKSAGEHERR